MKPCVVVDTNVPVVANGAAPQASRVCVARCTERLRGIMSDLERLVLDDDWRIIGEYIDNLRSSGQPGVGDVFLKWVLTNHANSQRCDLVAIGVHPTLSASFKEFPADPALADFDPSDRKFVAVALAHQQRPPIVQAVDTKWWDYRNALLRNGVSVDFLCREDIARLHAA